jgi:hypothetical protein
VLSYEKSEEEASLTSKKERAEQMEITGLEGGLEESGGNTTAAKAKRVKPSV